MITCSQHKHLELAADNEQFKTDGKLSDSSELT